MNQQRNEKSVGELRLKLAWQNLIAIIMLTVPILVLAYRMYLQSGSGFFENFPKIPVTVCFPIAILFAWLGHRTQKQIDRDLSRHPEGETVEGPIFELVIGGEKK